ncbi:MAG: phytanoyl-CoA dioxygenase family protein [Burkholderiales bacterium]|nr:phytanoyl-CoA dioxygenase family protein [Burkholderiales bacterium]
MTPTDSPEAILAHAEEPGFWRELCPQLHVEDADFLHGQQPLVLAPGTAREVDMLVRAEGHFSLPPQAFALPLERMAALVAELERRGVPPPFCFAYDEFWSLFLRMDALLQCLLGPGYLRLPDLWAWHIDPGQGQTGWPPHRDRGVQALFPDGSPKAVTLWIPLTDATLANSCIHVLPAGADRLYGKSDDQPPPVPAPSARALPAATGSVLGWNQALLHWGGPSEPQAPPRIAVAAGFQSGNAAALGHPTSAADTVPDLAARMRLVMQQLRKYAHPLAERLAAPAP